MLSVLVEVLICRKFPSCARAFCSLGLPKTIRARMGYEKFNAASGAARQDVYTRVTNQIIADLEKGVRPWVRPWSVAGAEPIMRPLRHNGLPYAGINVLILWCSALDHGFTSPTWMTFRQALELQGHVRKGEKGSLVVYADRIKKTVENEAGEETERNISFLKGYTVFNVDQIEGLPEQYRARPPPRFRRTIERIEHAEQFFAATKADIRYVGHPACYSEEGDYIRMPPPEAFKDAESFHATQAHEVIHWTKHSSRLAREFGKKTWGDENYAKEELVAEIGAAYVCADLAITGEGREDHAAYIGSWLKVLKDKRFIFTAASHAQRALDYLHSLQPPSDKQPDAPEL